MTLSMRGFEGLGKAKEEMEARKGQQRVDETKA